uniref:Uncharacterized protein n=1 Tax=Anguilla anguilla TaxID=7936 RepID=A0A0E9X5V6_ANGAN
MQCLKSSPCTRPMPGVYYCCFCAFVIQCIYLSIIGSHLPSLHRFFLLLLPSNGKTFMKSFAYQKKKRRIIIYGKYQH